MSNIIELVKCNDKPSEIEISGWRERAKVDPDWAARQIWGLLNRAITAEQKLAQLESSRE